MIEQVPFLLRREEKHLGGAVVPVGQIQQVALGAVSIIPIGKRNVFNLVRAFSAANRAEQMPTAIILNDGRVLDRIAEIVAMIDRPDEWFADSPTRMGTGQRTDIRPLGRFVGCMAKSSARNAKCGQDQ